MYVCGNGDKLNSCNFFLNCITIGDISKEQYLKYTKYDENLYYSIGTTLSPVIRCYYYYYHYFLIVNFNIE